MKNLNDYLQATQTTSIYIMIGKSGKCWFVGFGIPEILVFEEKKENSIVNVTRKFNSVEEAKNALAEYGLTVKGVTNL